MGERISDLDFEALERDGYVVLPGLVRAGELAQFERDVTLAGERIAEQRRIARTGGEAIADVLRASGEHRTLLFNHIKRLWVLLRLAADIGTALETTGLFSRLGLEVPLVWPTLRADLPGEITYAFPLHQDFMTTRSHRATRLWVPLSDVNRHNGTMEVATGSHRMGPFEYDTAGSYPRVRDSEMAGRSLTTKALELPGGDGVVFSPWAVHRSVANVSDRTKWVLLLHVQDLAAMVDPADPADPLQQFLHLSGIHATSP